jgi:hypothetical protein
LRKPVAISGAIVTLAAGFAVASIVTSGSLAALASVWTVTTSATNTVTVSNVTTVVTSTNPGDRHIEICRVHWGRHHRHHWFTRMVISQHGLAAFLRHGFVLAPCLGFQGSHHLGGGNGGKYGGNDDNGGRNGHHGDDDSGGSTGVSTFSATSSFSTSHGHGHGFGHGHGH